MRVQAAGLDLADFCVATDATIKCGIFYRDWNVVGDHYWHPFTALADTGPYTAAHHYQQMILEDPQRVQARGLLRARAHVVRDLRQAET